MHAILVNLMKTGRLRRLLLRINLAVIILLAILIFGMVNYLSMRHYARAHWSRNAPAPLSPRSLRLLESVDSDIRITALLRPGHAAYGRVAALLQEYAAHAAYVTVELVDPDRDLARAEQLARQYRLEGSECVVFEIGGRHHTVPAAALLDLQAPSNDAGTSRTTFHGEQLFSSAIYALTQATRPTVHFIQGHGERSPDDFDRHRGYSRLAARLRDENLDIEGLNLGEAKSVPNHCALMIIAGPVREFAPFEISLIRDYLNRKGRLLALLDARVRSGLEPLLMDWGVVLENDIVVDPERTLSGRELYISSYPNHPVTVPLQNLATVLYLPRSVRPRPLTPGVDKPVFFALATCSTAGWAEFDPDDAAVQFNPHADIPGPVPVAAAIERGPVPGVHVQIRPTRLVVIGDSQFAANDGLMGANMDLFLNAVNWLLERAELLELAPRIYEHQPLVMDARQLRRLFAAVVIVLPGLVALIGLGMAWRRRR